MDPRTRARDLERQNEEAMMQAVSTGRDDLHDEDELDLNDFPIISDLADAQKIDGRLIHPLPNSHPLKIREEELLQLRKTRDSFWREQYNLFPAEFGDHNSDKYKAWQRELAAAEDAVKQNTRSILLEEMKEAEFNGHWTRENQSSRRRGRGQQRPRGNRRRGRGSGRGNSYDGSQNMPANPTYDYKYRAKSPDKDLSNTNKQNNRAKSNRGRFQRRGNIFGAGGRPSSHPPIKQPDTFPWPDKQKASAVASWNKSMGIKYSPDPQIFSGEKSPRSNYSAKNSKSPNNRSSATQALKQHLKENDRDEFGGTPSRIQRWREESVISTLADDPDRDMDIDDHEDFGSLIEHNTKLQTSSIDADLEPLKFKSKQMFLYRGKSEDKSHHTGASEFIYPSVPAGDNGWNTENKAQWNQLPGRILGIAKDSLGQLPRESKKARLEEAVLGKYVPYISANVSQAGNAEKSILRLRPHPDSVLGPTTTMYEGDGLVRGDPEALSQGSSAKAYSDFDGKTDYVRETVEEKSPGVQESTEHIPDKDFPILDWDNAQREKEVIKDEASDSGDESEDIGESTDEEEKQTNKTKKKQLAIMTKWAQDRAAKRFAATEVCDTDDDEDDEDEEELDVKPYKPKRLRQNKAK
jgi:hypothetical protein